MIQKFNYESKGIYTQKFNGQTKKNKPIKMEGN